MWYCLLYTQSVDETLVCDHLNERYWAVLSCGTVYCTVQGGSNFQICGWNPSVWPFKCDWAILSFGTVCFTLNFDWAPSIPNMLTVKWATRELNYHLSIVSAEGYLAVVWKMEHHTFNMCCGSFSSKYITWEVNTRGRNTRGRFFRLTWSKRGLWQHCTGIQVRCGICSWRQSI